MRSIRRALYLAAFLGGGVLVTTAPRPAFANVDNCKIHCKVCDCDLTTNFCKCTDCDISGCKVVPM